MGKAAGSKHGKRSKRASLLYKETRHDRRRSMKIRMRKLRATRFQTVPGSDVQSPAVEDLPAEGEVPSSVPASPRPPTPSLTPSLRPSTSSASLSLFIST